ncbi:hypothetical protein ACHWQZ_G014015 [Mnemiopsis leidyi]
MRFGSAVAWEWKSRSAISLTWSKYYFQCPQDTWSTDCIKSFTGNRDDCAYFIQLQCSLPAGMFINDDKFVCCPENTYTLTHGRLTSCQDCPKGSTTQSNATSCICDRGSYWQEGTCSPCTSQICNCPKGMTWNGENLEKGTCVPCKPGTYRSEDMVFCTTCPSGSTSTEGQDYCLCTAGFYWNGAACVECEDDRASPAGARVCVPCLGETTSNKSYCDCPSGQIWTWITAVFGHCSLCPPGTYKNSVQDSCTLCPTKATSLAGSSSCICPAGTTWSDTKLNCEDCKPGQVSQAGSLKCTECPDGSVDKVTCSCHIGNVWSWIERERGECLCLNISQCLSQSESESMSGTKSESNIKQEIETQSKHYKYKISDSFVSFPLFLTLAITSGITTISCVCFMGLFIRERRRNGMKNSAKVFFRQEQQSPDNITVAVLQSQYQDLIIEHPEPRIEDSYSDMELKTEDMSISKNDEILVNTETTNDGMYNVLNKSTASHHMHGLTSATSDELHSVLRKLKPTSSNTDKKECLPGNSTEYLYSVPWKTTTAGKIEGTYDFSQPTSTSLLRGTTRCATQAVFKDSTEDSYLVPWKTKASGIKIERDDDDVYNTVDEEANYDTLNDKKQVSNDSRQDEMEEDGNYADAEEISQYKGGREI